MAVFAGIVKPWRKASTEGRKTFYHRLQYILLFPFTKKSPDAIIVRGMVFRGHIMGKLFTAALPLMAAALGICVAACQPQTVAPVAQHASVATFGEDLAPIKLDRVSFNIKRGDKIGIKAGSAGCAGSQHDLFWNEGRITGSDQELADDFYQEMHRANYNVVGDSNQLFSDQSADSVDPEYLVGARVDRIDMVICAQTHAVMFLDPDGTLKGSTQLTVTWQLFSTLERKVVLEVKTQGSSQSSTGTLDGDISLFQDAFAAAAGNLAADRRFHDLLAGKTPAGKVSGPVTDAPMSVVSAAAFQGGITTNAQAIEKAVVTVRSGAGQGSGFFIAPDLILTNYHVAGGSKHLKILLADGSQLDGSLTRAHAGRDVALIRVEDGHYNPLPLRLYPVKIAEEVYAIGTPLDDQFAGTVTRGVVSQLKKDKRGLEMIQADASIQHGSSGGPLLDNQGNVVGIAVAGIMAGAEETSVGLNFFIPIADALRYLNVNVR
jgi:S1-C subfamily serine protease